MRLLFVQQHLVGRDAEPLGALGALDSDRLAADIQRDVARERLFEHRWVNSSLHLGVTQAQLPISPVDLAPHLERRWPREGEEVLRKL